MAEAPNLDRTEADDAAFPVWGPFAPSALSAMREHVILLRRLRADAVETPAVRACRVWQEFLGEPDAGPGLMAGVGG